MRLSLQFQTDVDTKEHQSDWAQFPGAWRTKELQPPIPVQAVIRSKTLNALGADTMKKNKTTTTKNTPNTQAPDLLKLLQYFISRIVFIRLKHNATVFL